MDKNAIVVLPEGSEVPSDIKSKAKIIAFLQEDGSLKSDRGEFENMSEFFQYVGSIKKNV